MTESNHTLRDKALLALEDAIQEHRWRTPHNGHAVRFALAYLLSIGVDAGILRSFWLTYARGQKVFSFSQCDTALASIYGALGMQRPEGIGEKMRLRWRAELGEPASAFPGAGHVGR